MLPILAQTDFNSSMDTAAMMPMLLCSLAAAVVMIAAMWRIFSKAGRPGWAAIIPIYNTIVLLDVAGKPWWWIILFFIPLVNFIVALVVIYELAQSFGYGLGMFLVLLFFSPIGILWLGFGPAEYVREKMKY
jgi:uncharacterized membrane protein YhaH (DUF805 family)